MWVTEVEGRIWQPKKKKGHDSTVGSRDADLPDLDWPAFFADVEGDCQRCVATECLLELTADGDAEVADVGACIHF